MLAHGRYLPVSQVFYDFKDLCPTGKRPFVGPFVLVHGQDELKLLVVEFALFGTATGVGTPAAGSAAAFEAAPTVDRGLSAFVALASFGAIVGLGRGGLGRGLVGHDAIASLF